MGNTINNTNVKLSVVVVTYNSTWKKLATTLLSILNQKGINFQIVISDDGSEKFFYNQIVSLFSKCKFSNYQISVSNSNRGTVENIYNSICLCVGKYIKTISPGDYFYDESTLKDWVNFLEAKESRICFGDSIYYSNVNGKMNVLHYTSAPIIKNVYQKINNRKELVERYLVANDTILGAAVVFEKNTLIYLLNIIKDRLVYAEDFSIRIAVFENIKIDYLERNVIWYEYGTGISTKKENAWIRKLKSDFEMSNRIILQDNIIPDKYSRKYIKFLRTVKLFPRLKKIIKVIFYPSILIIRNEMKRKETKQIEVDLYFINKIRSQSQNLYAGN